MAMRCLVRTTIELPDHQRAALAAIAAKRKLRGYSTLVQEALDQYLTRQARNTPEIRALLSLKGAWGDDEATEARQAVAEVRANWDREPVT
jgi:predicted transcriptional regulator